MIFPSNVNNFLYCISLVEKQGVQGTTSVLGMDQPLVQFQIRGSVTERAAWRITD